MLIAAGMPLQRAEAGIRPGGRPPFLCATRKEAPIRAPQSATPSRCEGVNLRRGACGVRRGTHCAPAALRSDNHGESVDEACALRRACHLASTPTQAQPEGGWKPDTGHRCARPRGVQALRAAQAKPSAAMARGDVRSPGSLQDAPRSTAASGSGLAIV